MDLLYSGTLFQPELRLAVGTGQIAVGLEIPDLQVLTLEEPRYHVIDAEKAVVLIQPLGDVGRQRAKDRQRAQQQYDDHQNRVADKQIDHIQRSRNDPDEGIQFIVSVTTLHEFSDFCQKITQNITVAFIYHLSKILSTQSEAKASLS